MAIWIQCLCHVVGMCVALRHLNYHHVWPRLVPRVAARQEVSVRVKIFWLCAECKNLADRTWAHACCAMSLSVSTVHTSAIK